MLETITSLSHEFGTPDYVKGGGGNTSAKDEKTLWVKPSGTTLSGLTPQTFVALDRARLRELFEVETPAEPSAREALVKDMMARALCPGSAGRASVEAPLHESFSARYVVHTHPCFVSGLVCSNKAEAACRELFPEALWVEYVDPGYTLCAHVRQAIPRYVEEKGREPGIVFLQNHGVFVAGDTPEEVRERYARIMGRLGQVYREAGIATTLEIGPAPTDLMVADIAVRLREVMGGELAAHVVGSGVFAAADGPISPDHIVYSKAWLHFGMPTDESLEEFQNAHGYQPRVIVNGRGVFGVGASATAARLALELAQDGALVQQLAQAFGGLHNLDKRASDFIENWEVEAYRRQQTGS
jgi:rhamnose utilization protein RhaD (predicted bifunctional aldolase and dehydrogenase)